MTQKRYVVLDRDGTINTERHYLSDPDQVELITGTSEGLRQMSQMGLGLIVITNQSGVSRGFFEPMRLELIHQRLCKLLEGRGVSLDGIYVCPHKPEEHCLCRKPKLELMELAAKELSFDPQACFVIGDKACDMEFGKRAGATTLLVRTGYGNQFFAKPQFAPDYVVEDLSEGAKVIEYLLTKELKAEDDVIVRPHELMGEN